MASFLEGKSRKERNIIIGSIIALALIIMSVIMVVVYTTTESGKQAANNISTQFEKVELPSDSRDLTAVPKAQANVQDKSADPYIGVDMEGRRIDIPDKITLAPSAPGGEELVVDRPSTEQMNQVSDAGKIFNAPTVNINELTMGAVDEVPLQNGGSLIEPTNFTNMFTVRNRGIGENFSRQSAENGTLYLATHATDLGALAPGNFLVDNATKMNILREGDIVEAIDRESNEVLRYRITEYRSTAKDQVAADAEIWENKPGRIVILTCLPNTLDNSIFIGELI